MVEVPLIVSLPGWQSTPPVITENGLCLQLSSPAVPVPCPTCAAPRTDTGCVTPPVPGIAPAFARRTLALATAQRAIGLATGGAAGARLAMTLHMPTSAATLLRLIHSTPLPTPPLPTAIGVDDWAMRSSD